MNPQNLCSPYAQGRTDKAMTAEQFTQVIEAILAGKYSWACLLILRFAGYNPLHYIPYRTFNRLVKENMVSRNETRPKNSSKTPEMISNQSQTVAQRASNQISDLAHLDNLDDEAMQIKGSHHVLTWVGDRFPSYTTKNSIHSPGSHKDLSTSIQKLPKWQP